MKILFNTEKREHEKFWSAIGEIDYEKKIHKIRANLVNKYAIGSVCEIGCGEGGMANFLFIGGHNVVAIDFSKNVIKRAKDKYGDLPIDFRIMNAKNMSFNNNSFDTVTILETLEHTHKPEEILKEAARICKKRIIVTVPNKNIFPPDPLHYTDFDRDILAEYLAPFVKKVYFENLETDPKNFWLFAWGEKK